MRLLAITAIASFALPAAAQDYYEVTATAKHGNGYAPAAIVAGWERDTWFQVLAIAPDGARKNADGVAMDWKATLTTGPRAEADDDNEFDDRYLDKQATNPKSQKRSGPPVARSVVIYSSLTCPAIMTRMAALKPLTSFEFNPPALNGNKDGAVGDGREGLDLWIRAGDGELGKSAGAANSALGQWFQDSIKALQACPASPKTG
ncbi:MAG TPA: hypothetical protein VG942_17070 [Hyphomonadaceae bacterium]|nr:hypothetical protein [Hyphomonadaceae bacterium]